MNRVLSQKILVATAVFMAMGTDALAQDDAENVAVASRGVFANNISFVIKGSENKSVPFAPNTCLTPTGTSVNPVAIPYPNISQLPNGTYATKTPGSSLVLEKVPGSSGDDAGSAAGVIRSVDLSRKDFLIFSPNVEVEGENVARRLQNTTTNSRSAPPVNEASQAQQSTDTTAELPPGSLSAFDRASALPANVAEQAPDAGELLVARFTGSPDLRPMPATPSSDERVISRGADGVEARIVELADGRICGVCLLRGQITAVYLLERVAR